MPKVTPGSDSPTPKKRGRKTTSVTGNGTHPENGNGAQVVEAVPASSEIAVEMQVAPGLEEQIRVRAYELYVQRGGNGGSPEQDWLRAQEEVCGR
ncbi:MAG: DUF2934 domain-containing protein [Candidatus Korobacteraceae bacterium]